MQVKTFRDDSTPSGSSTWPGLDQNRSQVHLKHKQQSMHYMTTLSIAYNEIMLASNKIKNAKKQGDRTDQEGPEDNPWNSNLFDDMDLDEVST
jgi:hypothetical protein